MEQTIYSKNHYFVLLTAALSVCFLLSASVLSPPASAQKKIITLATDKWEPFYGPDIKNQGYFIEITKEAFKRKGYDCKIEFVPWKRAFETAKRGQFDGVLGIFYKEKRTAFFEYSIPISESRMVFWAKKDRRISYNSLSDLKPFKIGYVYGYFYNTAFEEADYLTKIKAYNTEVNIKLLIQGKLDLIIASDKVVYYLLQNKFGKMAGSVKPLNKPLAVNRLHIVISKRIDNSLLIIENFNRGIDEIKRDGTFEKIMKKHGF